MPAINPAVTQWISQMGDRDQVVAYFAYHSLEEEVFKVSRPGQTAAQAALAKVLGEALTAEAKPGAGTPGSASFRNNAFLTAAAQQRPEPLHPVRVRTGLARLLGYLSNETAVPFLARALGDLDARETARQALEGNPSERATDALIAALDSPGPDFCVGVIHSLAKRNRAKAAAALRKAARDPQVEIRIAALQGLANIPEPAHDGIIAEATLAASPNERRTAHVARARLAANLQSAGNGPAAERIYRAILAADSPEPQKKAARLALRL
jgi:hypothetical protein